MFAMSAKSFGFGNLKNESNYKTKSFGYERRRKRKVSLPALLAIAAPLANIKKKNEKTIRNFHIINFYY
ncbi:hypothetical protein SAMN04488009_0113 [Maribacter sedimenticola]|uniref:Uncharacterized protein n=1 Tax=Maribacter sedimenticola TaxID=228956 RepID=A0ABY1SMD1_9FLAO|nr:hypothetical protein SAMN04488009_0113 [Maribacter sedimenticola]